MTLFPKRNKTKPAAPAKAAPAAAVTAVAVETAREIDSREKDSELLAVIAAAVAAYGADAYEPKLKIQKIWRVAGVRPVWAATGTSEAIDARRM